MITTNEFGAIEAVEGDYMWMEGFDAAVRDTEYDTDTLNALGLHACDGTYENSNFPPFCSVSVEAALFNFSSGSDMEMFLGGYNAANSTLRLEAGVSNV